MQTALDLGSLVGTGIHKPAGAALVTSWIVVCADDQEGGAPTITQVPTSPSTAIPSAVARHLHVLYCGTSRSPSPPLWTREHCLPTISLIHSLHIAHPPLRFAHLWSAILLLFRFSLLATSCVLILNAVRSFTLRINCHHSDTSPS